MFNGLVRAPLGHSHIGQTLNRAPLSPLFTRSLNGPLQSRPCKQTLTLSQVSARTAAQRAQRPPQPQSQPQSESAQRISFRGSRGKQRAESDGNRGGAGGSSEQSGGSGSGMRGSVVRPLVFCFTVCHRLTLTFECYILRA